MEVNLQITIKGLPEEFAIKLGNKVGEFIKGFINTTPRLDLIGFISSSSIPNHN